MDLSFSGAGFMGCYYFGVVDCWQKYVPRERVNRVAGASAGSLIAAYYLMDLPLVPCLKAIIDMTTEIRKRPLGVFDRSYQIVDILPQTLDKLFPPDAHKRVSGRLFVCMTRLKDMKKIIVSEFETRQDLIDALNCSCFIPVWSGNHVSTYKGVKHIDGGFSDNLPVFDEHTIRICCFAGQTDISPYDSKKSQALSGTVLNTPLYFNFANMKRGCRALFPPPAKVIVEMLERGFHDTKQFILTNDIIQCDECYNSSRPEKHFFSTLRNPLITPTGSPKLVRNPNEKPAMLKSADGLLSVHSSAKVSLQSGAKKRSDSHVTETSSSGASSLDTPPSQEDDDEQRNHSDSSDASGEKEKGRDYGAEFEQSNASDREAFSRLLCDKLRAEVEQEAAENSLKIRLDVNNNLDASNQNCDLMNPISIVIDVPIQENAASKPRRNVKALKLNLNAANVQDSKTEDEGVVGDDDVMSAEEEELMAKRAAQELRSRRPTLPANVPSQKFLERRRATVQADGPLLVRAEKFKTIGVPLPSCPPSPNLDRHCNECLRMRQAARVDHLEDEVRRTAAEFLPGAKEAAEELERQEKSGEQASTIDQDCQRKPANSKRKLTRSLTSPLRWIKQTMGSKSQYSYTLEDVPAIELAPEHRDLQCS